MNYSAFGATHRPTSEIGAKTLTATLRNAIPAPSYPWAAQGGATMRAVVILVRKPSAGSR